jgi:hypothetical protein
MPTRRVPNTIPSIIRNLKTAGDTYLNTPLVIDRAISAELYDKLDRTKPSSVLSRLLKEASDVDIAQANQAPLSSQISKLGAQLTMTVSHFHQVLDMGIQRGYFMPGARSYYGRDVSATTIPVLSSYGLVDEEAENILNGEIKRQEAEGPEFRPMALPNAAEVKNLRDQFHAMRNANQVAQVDTDKQKEELQALYDEAHDLAVDICDTVEFFYRKDPDASSRRSKCNETPDEAPAPSAPAATPAPAPTT